MYKRMYLAHIKTILLENFDNGTYATTGQTLQTLITTSVQADNNKFFTNANFIANLNSDIGGGPGPGGGSYPGITNLMNGRSAYLLGLSEFTATEPTITNVTPSNATPNINDVVSITTTITNENAVYIGYRDDVYAPFTRTLMFDDGAHNDGAANDGVYGFDLTMTDLMIQYYIYADNSNMGKFSPARAEYEYHILETFTPAAGDLVINEFQADNNNTVTDQNGENEDWIELHNNTNASIDISGYYLSDDASNVLQWTVPSGTTIAANGYLIVWCDRDTIQSGLHTNFQISSGGETLFLSDNSAVLLDQISFGAQTEDLTYARFPNGTGNFQEMYPTFNSVNIDVTGVDESNSKAIQLNVYPNPASSIINIELINNNGQIENVIIYNIAGRQIAEFNMNNQIQYDCSPLAAGLYIIKTNTDTKRVIIQ